MEPTIEQQDLQPSEAAVDHRPVGLWTAADDVEHWLLYHF